MRYQRTAQGCPVITERKTRRKIIPSPDKTSASVAAALDTLKRKVSSKVFPPIFQSVTCDNGANLLGASGSSAASPAE